MNNNQCIVLFPVYRSLDETELKVLKQAVKMTEGYTCAFVTSQSFTPDESYEELKNLPVFRFNDAYFKSTYGYNQLMLSLEFYMRFENFEYILIHQTDACLFKPELKYWCDRAYDYIGSPWYKPRKIDKTKLYRFLSKYCRFFYPERTIFRFKIFNNVGNGGLSLRKVDSFISILKNIPADIIEKYRENEKESFWFEDVFWSIEAPQFTKNFKKPDVNEALHFSFEFSPEKAYKKIGNQLPFGCHGFNRYNPNFWKQFIK